MNKEGCSTKGRRKDEVIWDKTPLRMAVCGAIFQARIHSACRGDARWEATEGPRQLDNSDKMGLPLILTQKGAMTMAVSTLGYPSEKTLGCE